MSSNRVWLKRKSNTGNSNSQGKKGRGNRRRKVRARRIQIIRLIKPRIKQPNNEGKEGKKPKEKAQKKRGGQGGEGPDGRYMFQLTRRQEGGFSLGGRTTSKGHLIWKRRCFLLRVVFLREGAKKKSGRYVKGPGDTEEGHKKKSGKKMWTSPAEGHGQRGSR